MINLCADNNFDSPVKSGSKITAAREKEVEEVSKESLSNGLRLHRSIISKETCSTTTNSTQQALPQMTNLFADILDPSPTDAPFNIEGGGKINENLLFRFLPSSFSNA